MTDFTTQRGATVARAIRLQPGRCAQCRCEIVGGRKRRYCRASCREQARVDRSRNSLKSPEELASRHAAQKRWRESSVGRRSQLATKRKGRLDRTQGYRTREVYLARMARQNRKRIKKTLLWLHLNKTKYAGTDLVPTCVTCGVEVSYANRGRPRKRCPLHHRGRGIRR